MFTKCVMRQPPGADGENLEYLEAFQTRKCGELFSRLFGMVYVIFLHSLWIWFSFVFPDLLIASSGMLWVALS